MIGQTISHYKILSELGRGGMGIVYKAEDTRLERIVALKFLSSSALEDDQSKARFIHEAKAAAALNHPNICTIYEIDQADGQPFIAMEYIEGTSIKQKVESRPLPLDEALDIAIQAAQGIHAAHRREIVHRDIKSANIMVTSEGLTKVMDFGLAQLAGGTKLTKTGSSLGTPAYMSPEQALGEKVDRRSDIWSFGVVLYEMVTGQLPYKGEVEAAVAYAIINEEPEPPTGLRSGVPIELDRVISKVLAKSREERYQHIDELLVDLRALRREVETARAKRAPSRQRRGQVLGQDAPSGQGAAEVQDRAATAPAGAEPGARPSELSLLRYIGRPRIAIPLFIVIVALIASGTWLIRRNAKIRWAKNEAIPRIARLVDEQQYIAAFGLAHEAEQFIPDEPELTALWPKISREPSVETGPPGADVYVRDYADTEAEWQHLGQSPVKGVRIPLRYSRWRITKQGYEELEAADDLGPYNTSRSYDLRFQLRELGSVPPEMLRVSGGTFQQRAGLLGMLGPVELPAYLVDRFEVTNRNFKEFVDRGGYQNREYWTHEFIRDGMTLSWEEARAEFRDDTGRPGPSTWALGTYPDGEDDFPVAGVSWHEAAAYAEFAGKSLPTIYDWHYAATVRRQDHIIPLSNFGTGGPARVGSFEGISVHGAYDMAGNVKEWCWNTLGDQRLILGGAWNEPRYMFVQVDAKSPFDRSATNGFRCVRHDGAEAVPKDLTRPVERRFRDYTKEQPVSEETVRIYKNMFAYDRTELNAKTESVDDSPPYWIKETITFSAAYGDERMIAHLFRPKHVAPPYQTVIHFPGSGALRWTSSENLQDMGQIAPIIRSGRAVLYPVYKGMYERSDQPDQTLGPRASRDRDIMWVRDLGRSVDYLESRIDIRHDQLAFYGASLGAWRGPVLLAVEDRFQAAVFLNGGLYLGPREDSLPEVDPFNFVPRVKLPVLMLNGENDLLFPVNESQRIFFRLLGTAEKDKRHVIIGRGHARLVPSNEEIRETLDWLDRYLGPVN